MLDIDYGRCVVCQLCIEACPTGAMSPSSDWAFGVARRVLILIWKADANAVARDRRQKRVAHFGAACISATSMPAHATAASRSCRP